MTAAIAGTGQIEYGIPLGSVLRASYANGKVAVPVSNYTLFAQFKHFTAVPAPTGGYGYSISRLRTLDFLIDNLARAEGNAQTSTTEAMRAALSEAAHSTPASDVAQLAPRSIDQIISDFGSRLNAIVERADATQFATPVRTAATAGALMSLTA